MHREKLRRATRWGQAGLAGGRDGNVRTDERTLQQMSDIVKVLYLRGKLV